MSDARDSRGEASQRVALRVGFVRLGTLDDRQPPYRDGTTRCTLFEITSKSNRAGAEIAGFERIGAPNSLEWGLLTSVPSYVPFTSYHATPGSSR